MIDILHRIGTPIAATDRVGLPLDGKHADVVIWPRRRWPRMGIVFKNEALVLDYRTFMSFRVRSGNLGYSRDLKIRKHRGEIDKEYLANYFAENSDNPYALYNVMRAIHLGNPLRDLTQFPPLLRNPIPERDYPTAIEKLITAAELGDMVFSSTATDSISSIIRKEDQGQFSHCAPYVGNGEVVDAGPQGVIVNSLRDYPYSTRLALYRLRGSVTEEQRRNMATLAREQAAKGCGYNYLGIIKIFLRKKLGVPIPNTAPSVADLLYSNKFILVDFT